MSELFVLAREGCDLAGERWPGGAQLVVLLHEGVSDRRGWRQVAGLLAPQATVVAYDRRGYGESALSTAPFAHVDDVLAVLDREQAGQAWLGQKLEFIRTVGPISGKAAAYVCEDFTCKLPTDEPGKLKELLGAR